MADHFDRSRSDIETKIAGTALGDLLRKRSVAKADFQHVSPSELSYRDLFQQVRIKVEVPLVEFVERFCRGVADTKRSRQPGTAKFIPICNIGGVKRRHQRPSASIGGALHALPVRFAPLDQPMQP